MIHPYGSSANWVVDDVTNDIYFLGDDGEKKFYEIRRRPEQGNPVIFQATPGRVYLTAVGDSCVVCERESLLDANWHEFSHYRVTRRSFHNPDQFPEASNLICLGEVYSNSQRVMGAPEEIYFQRLPELPEGDYALLTVREALSLRDGLGHAAIAKALAAGLLTLD